MSSPSRLSLCPALNVDKVADRILERQRTELLATHSESLDALPPRVGETISRGQSLAGPSISMRRSAKLGSMAYRMSITAGHRDSSSLLKEVGAHSAPASPRNIDHQDSEAEHFSDEMDHALLPRRVSIMLMMEESQVSPFAQRQRTRMEEIAEELQQSRGGGLALAIANQVSVAKNVGGPTPSKKLTGKALHRAVFNSLKHNEKMLNEIGSKTAVELEMNSRKDHNGMYEDDVVDDDSEEHPALNRLRNRQLYAGQASIRFRDDNVGASGMGGASIQASQYMKSLKSLLLRSGIGDDSMSIKSHSGMRHVIDSFTSAPIKMGSMRRGEGSMNGGPGGMKGWQGSMNGGQDSMNGEGSTYGGQGSTYGGQGSMYGGQGSMRRVLQAAHSIINGPSPSFRRNSQRFDQNILLSLEQSFADMATNRLKRIEESIQLPLRTKHPQPQNLLPSLPNDEQSAPPRDLHTREGVRYTGAFGRVSDIQRKLEKEKLLLIKANPAAFQPDEADKAEARHQTMIELARMRFDDSVKSQMQDKEVDSFFKSLQGLRVARPFFLPPIYSKDKLDRQQRKGLAAQKVWSIEKSFFAHRTKEAESKQLLDDENIKNIQFEADWQRVVSKERFRRQIGIVERGKSRSTKNTEEELLEVQGEIFQAKDALRNIFTYYSADNGPMDSAQCLVLSLDKWLSFCADVGLLDPSSPLTRNDLSRIFSAVNFEEDDSAENLENDDNAMMRFEFLEGIVRAAFGRYIFSGKMKDASDACKLFIDSIILSKVPPEALVDPNSFRQARLYSADVEAVLIEYQDLILACFKLYKARDKSKYFWIEHWAAFLEALSLLGPHTGLDRQEAKLLFFWSQAMVSDELKRRKRAVGLVFFDFVEAVARLADYISPRSTEELLEMRPAGDAHLPGEQRERQLEILREMTMVGDRPGNRSRPGSSGAALLRTIERPQSAGLVSKPSRPLAKKLTYLLEYISAHSMDAWGGKTSQECAQRMLEEAETLSRGIELG